MALFNGVRRRRLARTWWGGDWEDEFSDYAIMVNKDVSRDIGVKGLCQRLKGSRLKKKARKLRGNR